MKYNLVIKIQAHLYSDDIKTHVEHDFMIQVSELEKTAQFVRKSFTFEVNLDFVVILIH